MLKQIGLVAAIVLPLWNIPLILKIWQRRSSKDISLAWALGVLTCLSFMLPSGLVSPDPIFRIFITINFILFSTVVIFVLRYR